MDEQQIENYFQGLELPHKLLPLLRFDRQQAGGDYFSQGFELAIDADKHGLRSYSEEVNFLEALYEFASADGTGSSYCFWLKDGNKNLQHAPVVVFGSEGGYHVVARNFDELLQLLSYDCEAMVDWDDVSYYKDPDESASAASAAFHRWLQQYDIALIDDADALVAQAQATYQQPFYQWMAQFYQT